LAAISLKGRKRRPAAKCAPARLDGGILHAPGLRPRTPCQVSSPGFNCAGWVTFRSSAYWRAPPRSRA